MDFILNIFAVPVSYIFKGLGYVFGHNFALLSFLLTLIINLLLLPLTIKSQKATANQQRVRPKLDLLKKKYGDNMTQQDKLNYNTEMQELYKKEGVSLSGGCLPLLIKFPFILAIYRVVQSPLTYIFSLGTDKIEKLAKAVGVAPKGYFEMQTFSKLTAATKGMTAELWAEIESWRFSFLGIDLKATPDFTLNFASLTSEQLVLWLIPIMACAAQIFTSFVSMRVQKKINPDAPTMSGMMYGMSLFTLFIAFSLPCAVGLYWVFSSLCAGLLQTAVQLIYSPAKLIAQDQAKHIININKKEQV